MNDDRKAINDGVFAKLLGRAQKNAAGLIDELCRDDNELLSASTPDEKILLASIIAELKLGMHELDSVVFPQDRNSAYVGYQRKVEHGPFLFVSPRKLLLDWPVGLYFTISSPHGQSKGLVVECGDRQAASVVEPDAARPQTQDLRLQKAGYTVLRLSSSDIRADPCGCADAVIDWAVGEYCF